MNLKRKQVSLLQWKKKKSKTRKNIKKSTCFPSKRLSTNAPTGWLRFKFFLKYFSNLFYVSLGMQKNQTSVHNFQMWDKREERRSIRQKEQTKPDIDRREALRQSLTPSRAQTNRNSYLCIYAMSVCQDISKTSPRRFYYHTLRLFFGVQTARKEKNYSHWFPSSLLPIRRLNSCLIFSLAHNISFPVNWYSQDEFLNVLSTLPVRRWWLLHLRTPTNLWNSYFCKS